MDSILELKNITKRFTNTLALNNVNYNLKPGEIHAIIGENGAGKSTLIKIMTGYHKADVGDIFLKGEKIIFSDTKSSYEHGIAAIYQEASLFSGLTVAENIFMGHYKVNPITKAIKWSSIYKETIGLTKSLGINLDPKALLKSLGFAEKQLVEIIKALSQDIEILIMDEPTSALTSEETSYLFKIIKNLKAQSVGIVFISHKIEEVMEIADRVTVLRDGKLVGTCEKKDLNEEKLISMMVGRELGDLFPKSETKIEDTVLEIKNLSRAGEFNNISFNLKKGEIVGLAGLVGAGRTELAKSIFGVTKLEGGEILINGKRVNINNPRKALELGIAYLSESRGEYGLVLQMDIAKNITLPILRKVSKFGLLNQKEEDKIAYNYYRLLNIRAYGLRQRVGDLSGGNQQKVAIAKWLGTHAKILILDEPTRGVDISTKVTVHQLMDSLAKDGLAILMISSELPEIIGMSDRVLVMHEGVLTKELSRFECSQEGILKSAITVNLGL
jgi:ABC-type sugar transport system ATPase subunit